MGTFHLWDQEDQDQLENGAQLDHQLLHEFDGSASFRHLGNQALVGDEVGGEDHCDKQYIGGVAPRAGAVRLSSGT